MYNISYLWYINHLLQVNVIKIYDASFNRDKFIHVSKDGDHPVICNSNTRSQHTCLFACFYMQPLIASSQIIGAHCTDVGVVIRLLSGKTWLQTKNSTGRRWDSNPGSCSQHGHCCKRTKPLHHLDTRMLLPKNTLIYLTKFLTIKLELRC